MCIAQIYIFPFVAAEEENATSTKPESATGATGGAAANVAVAASAGGPKAYVPPGRRDGARGGESMMDRRKSK